MSDTLSWYRVEPKELAQHLAAIQPIVETNYVGELCLLEGSIHGKTECLTIKLPDGSALVVGSGEIFDYQA